MGKRQPAQQKAKALNKTREADRKAKKKDPSLRSKARKDPGIPNLAPFKAKLLAQAEESQAQLADNKAQLRQRRLAMQKAALRTAAGHFASAPPTAEEPQWQEQSTKQSQGAYYREFQKIMEKADVILQVLDARDPIGTRAVHVEKMILESGTGKRVILVLNKVDLVPKDNVQQWLAYLRHEFPTIAFKASTQAQRRNLGQGNVRIEHATEAMLQSSESIGADILVKLLKNYSRNQDIKTSVTVGVIGYPNVGKSSLINSLKRAKVCGIGATPGLTKVVQEIHLDKNIKLLDCPGIVFSPERADATWQERAAVQLRNCMRVESLADPITPVELILTRAAPATLCVLYGIPPFKSTNEFLFHVGKARGKLKRGGVPDVEDAARAVLNDWNHGKIPYYSVPPKRDLGGGAAIVDQFADQLDLDAGLASLMSEQELGAEFAARHAQGGMDVSDDDDEDMMDDDDDVMDEDDDDDSDDSDDGAPSDAIVVPDLASTGSRKHAALLRAAESEDSGAAPGRARKQMIMTDEEAALNPRTNQQRRKQAKQARKLAAKLEGKMSDNVRAWVQGDVDMDMDEAPADANEFDFGEFARM
ncbi:hypothetical protein AMAG_06080 [Allomyces macrogynus ATCC 38327]|uniref:CP-type G domain-containing protein n=1 Tax=Allomyces macrogynus (strain ATCC 38327) TaxID=578462 RepID=A0A0L0SE54_ALLM3|nr:hypothetical protein AMAG_06080 [Allomyces macrogynus ATCC 38327]|eukprot:KNE60717.1 hypothetical protein AMAG_06080 [Allomyces macrogynus ATCC 38327]